MTVNAQEQSGVHILGIYGAYCQNLPIIVMQEVMLWLSLPYVVLSLYFLILKSGCIYISKMTSHLIKYYGMLLLFVSISGKQGNLVTQRTDQSDACSRLHKMVNYWKPRKTSLDQVSSMAFKTT